MCTDTYNQFTRCPCRKYLHTVLCNIAWRRGADGDHDEHIAYLDMSKRKRPSHMSHCNVETMTTEVDGRCSDCVKKNDDDVSKQWRKGKKWSGRKERYY
ncbi:hypothetical protein PFICI_08977 [Pestalotiopsis fici W106-1]|uniref:Uncharacterized protein n=1 Tax=Pestalotiopsis fici (strain W106-1 / CGMCC3.15140) TaxID=1229662 RepID=W3WZB0_PESFW|nr:uncharacterized protein PFICI_08977 [Pestalotiopsis fici W106-1]ETS79124.1 hypothetical protein PFICI_08977 [Pestalotiopsis fici W106-1]